MKTRHQFFVSLLPFLLPGCGSVPVEHIYSLDAITPYTETSAAAEMRLSVGPVYVPAVLDRSQMVWRTQGNRLVIAEQSRWAEPLPSLIGRVVTDNMVRQLPGTLPASQMADSDIRIELDIRRLDAEPGHAVRLEVDWTIRQSSGTKHGRAHIREAVASPAVEDLVAAHAHVLNHLSRAIATDLRNLP